MKRLTPCDVLEDPKYRHITPLAAAALWELLAARVRSGRATLPADTTTLQSMGVATSQRPARLCAQLAELKAFGLVRIDGDGIDIAVLISRGTIPLNLPRRSAYLHLSAEAKAVIWELWVTSVHGGPVPADLASIHARGIGHTRKARMDRVLGEIEAAGLLRVEDGTIRLVDPDNVGLTELTQHFAGTAGK